MGGLAIEIPRIHIDNDYPMAKDDWGYVTSKGHIYLNPRKEGTVGEWTWVLAHCMLHLGMGHFIDIYMDDPAWHTACDIAVTRFLLDSRIGTPPRDVSTAMAFSGSDEVKLYKKFCLTQALDPVRISEPCPLDDRICFGKDEADTMISKRVLPTRFGMR